VNSPNCTIEIRVIEPSDIVAMAEIIRTVMAEFGAVGEGYSIEDLEVDDMYASYSGERERYFVALSDGVILGGAGIAKLLGGEERTCELRKMYLLPEGRGLGVGEHLLDLCLAAAEELGFAECYLETLGRMEKATKLYLKLGFEALRGPMGVTGHHGCDSWLLKRL
jgi:putative acetyltransferase